MPFMPWSNPGTTIKKNTNEVPAELKTATAVKKAKKTKKDKNKKAKKNGRDAKK